MDSPTLKHGAAQCSNCSRPAAAACAGCEHSPPMTLDSQPTFTYYCSSTCQAAAWPTHKHACKALKVRRSLYRAADTVQKAFLIYREKVFEKLFTKVHEKDGILYLTEGQYDKDDVLIPFPEELVKNRRDREAVLTHLTCMDALGWMHNFIKMMLEGFHAHLEENTIKLKRPRRSTKVVSVYGGPDEVDFTTFQHEILKIILPSGETFALDIASAQYGFHSPLVPWIDFYRLRVEVIQRVRHFGSARAWFEEQWRKSRGTDTKPLGDVKEVRLEAAMFGFNRKFTAAFDEAVKEWLHREYWTESFSKMLKLPVEVFDKRQEELVGFIEQKLQCLKDMMIWNGVLGRRFQTDNKVPTAKGTGKPTKKVEAGASRREESAEDVLSAMQRKPTSLKTVVKGAKLVETKLEQTQARQAKTSQTTAQDINTQDTKAQDTKAQDTKAQDTKAQDTKAQDTKAQETKADAIKPQNQEAQDPKVSKTKEQDPKAEDNQAQQTKLGEAF